MEQLLGRRERLGLTFKSLAQPLVVHKPTGRVIGGNGRLTAMRALGWTHADVVELDMSDTQATALGIALNRTAELAEWDLPSLGKLLESLQADGSLDGVGFDADELQDVLDDTAYIERLNLVIRRSLSCLHRKTDSAAKSRTKLTEAIDRLRCYYNFIRPHGALKFGREIRTPAQQAGLVSKRLSFRDIFMAFRPMARVPWIRDERVRNAWIGRHACAGNNS